MGSLRNDVVLISMPFGPVLFPSLALSLLKAGLRGSGASVDIRYFTLPFASLIGERVYSSIGMSRNLTVVEMAGEWIFSGALSPQSSADVSAYIDDILLKRHGNLGPKPPVAAKVIDQLVRARSRVDEFLDSCLDEVAAREPKLVGFTSVFQQHVASLALAKRIKRRLPDTQIVFGGANCEGVMGLETLRQFPFVDAVVSGEGDIVFPRIVQRALEGRSLTGLQGVHTQDSRDAPLEMGVVANAPTVTDMDALPCPDYGDYFRQFRKTRFAGEWIPGVFVETSRGCWWGERSHCTFCGLNGSTMAYRSKSPDRALDELEWLSRTHRGSHIHVVDNILDLGYFKTLLPQIAERKLDLGLFYETKSNLKKDQVRTLARARVRRIQPGIESLSNDVLRLMRKGVSALHNIQILKWCREFGLESMWNLLWGFPGEPPEAYEHMARLIPLLTHLQPPVGRAGVRLDRFSPNFHDPEGLGFTNVEPLPVYRHIYDLEAGSLGNLASYFRYDHADGRDPYGYVRPVLRQLDRWKQFASRSCLFTVDVEGRLFVWDMRGLPREQWAPLRVLRDLDRELYLACDEVTEVRQLAQRFLPDTDVDAAVSRIERRLKVLETVGLMLQDGSRYLSLAIPLGEYMPDAAQVNRFHRVVESLGRRSSNGVVVELNGAGEVMPRRGQRATSRRAHLPGRGGRRRKLEPANFGIDGRGNLVIRKSGGGPPPRKENG